MKQDPGQKTGIKNTKQYIELFKFNHKLTPLHHGNFCPLWRICRQFLPASAGFAARPTIQKKPPERRRIIKKTGTALGPPRGLTGFT
jgi:hypothetical protein